MKLLCRAAILSLAVCLITPILAHAAWIWTPETKGWINPKHAVKDTADEQLKWGLKFYEAKDYKRANSEFSKLIRFYPDSSYASKAQYYIGRSYEDMEEYYHAYLAYQKMIEAYPYAKNRDDVIKRQYNIGGLFLEGQKAKILGVSLLPAVDKAIEIFEQVVKNSPYGDYADDAQFKIGESYKKSGRFAEAAMAFQRLTEEYARSELAEEADYQVARCTYLASLDYAYDQETTDAAIERFEGFVKEAGEGSLSEEARKTLDRLREKKAQALYDTAAFYEKTGHRNSALIYYKELAEKYPRSSLAIDTVSKIMEIEKRSAKR